MLFLKLAAAAVLLMYIVSSSFRGKLISDMADGQLYPYLLNGALAYVLLIL